MQAYHLADDWESLRGAGRGHEEAVALPVPVL